MDIKDYNSKEEVLGSDHRPVSLAFNLNLEETIEEDDKDILFQNITIKRLKIESLEVEFYPSFFDSLDDLIG
jgi:hypothetical protein